MAQMEAADRQAEGQGIGLDYLRHVTEAHSTLHVCFLLFEKQKDSSIIFECGSFPITLTETGRDS